MSTQRIQVTFDPASPSEAQFSFSPERAVLTSETSAVEVSLQTRGGSGALARFSESEGLRWLHEGPPDLEQTLDPGRTILTLRGFPRNESQEGIDYGYTVTVEYEGKTFSSTGQYPVMSCTPTGGG